MTGTSFAEGGRTFRCVNKLDWFDSVSKIQSHSWCQTHPEYFAISSQSPTKGAVLHVHNYSYVHAPPTVFTLRPKPHFIRDFDFLAMGGIPRLVAAVGRTLAVFPIGEDT